MTNRTLTYDADTGKLLKVYPDDLKQVRKGAEFYVGQDRHRVVDKRGGGEEDLVLILKRESEEPT